MELSDSISLLRNEFELVIPQKQQLFFYSDVDVVFFKFFFLCFSILFQTSRLMCNQLIVITLESIQYFRNEKIERIPFSVSSKTPFILVGEKQQQQQQQQRINIHL